MGTQEILQLLLSLGTLVTVIIMAYKGINDPDVKASQKIAVMEERFKNLTEDLKTIKENHLTHMEADLKKLAEKVGSIDKAQGQILTILKERE